MVRKPLYEKFAEMGFKIGAEIGVYAGANARFMFECIPGLKLYLVDSWERNKRHSARRAYRMTRQAVKDYDAVIIRGKSERVVHQVNDNSLDFVYIDADHSYDAVMLDIILWNRKVRNGGIVSGHDYYVRRKKFGVRNAVDDYVRYHDLPLSLFRAGRRGMNRNWFWLKS